MAERSIYHFGAAPDVNALNGLNFTVYCLAESQAAAGHEVALFLQQDPTAETREWSRRCGVDLLHTSDLEAQLRRHGGSALPPAAHLHSAYRPEQLKATHSLTRAGATIVLTPNGALIPQAMRRSRGSRLKKEIYAALFERYRLSRAHALVGTTPGEARSLARYLRPHQILTSIPNPAPRLRPVEGVKRLRNRVVYLGRYDVQHKGLERLASLARGCPDVEFHLYGAAKQADQTSFDEYRARLPANAYVHDPVFGREKERVLSEASLLIMPSAWEAFGIVLVEGMLCGAPCLVSSGAFLSEVVRENEVGFVLPEDPAQDARCLRDLLSRKSLCETSARAEAFARGRYDPSRVAAEYVRLYDQAAR
jgi:glycosyltransferase involved in cell wall biosynthesis